jgi:hypothetical protein
VVTLGWRHSRFDTSRAWSGGQAMAIHAASCQKVLGTLAFRRSRDPKVTSLHVQLVTELQELSGQDSPVLEMPSSPAPTDTHVLFFDGGCRDNPEPGDSGACVVRVDHSSGAADVV